MFNRNETTMLLARINSFACWCCLAFLGSLGCGGDFPQQRSTETDIDLSAQSIVSGQSFAEARSGFRTRIVRQIRADYPTPPPPPELFELVKYNSPAGALDAYVSPDPGDGAKHPAIVWIFGGFDNSINETAWEDAPPENDQSARAFREAGLIMLYPSFRGGNQNPGTIESFSGEVDDVLAAAEYLSRLNYVDPNRIYLGGHSTGGTLALLVAASSDRFRTVFSFGPVGNIVGYGVEEYGFDINSRPEFELRDPIWWLNSIETPTLVIEGEDGNVDSLREMAQSTQNPKLHFFPVKGVDHFSILSPVTRLLAEKVIQDTGTVPGIVVTEQELNAAVRQP